MSNQDKLKELIEVEAGTVGCVWATVKANKVLMKWKKKEPQNFARFKAILKKYCEYGREHLDDTKLKREGRFPCEGKNIRVLAFKGRQFRFYGGLVTHENKIIFIATEADMTKKQDKADQAKLKRAAEYLYPYL